MVVDLALQALIFLVVLLSMIVILATTRKGKIEIKDATNWFFVSLALMASAVFPGVLAQISSSLGFQVPANAVFSFLFFVVFCIIYYLNIRISRLSLQHRELVQNISLLELELLRRGRDTGNSLSLNRGQVVKPS